MVGGPYTILCQTQGNIASSTSTAMLDPMTGQNAMLPEGAAVKEISIYRDSDNPITSGCTIQLGTASTPAKYIAGTDSISTTDLNNGHIVIKGFGVSKGLTDAAELRLVLSNALGLGAIMFEVTYVVYA